MGSATTIVSSPTRSSRRRTSKASGEPPGGAWADVQAFDLASWCQ